MSDIPSLSVSSEQGQIAGIRTPDLSFVSDKGYYYTPHMIVSKKDCTACWLFLGFQLSVLFTPQYSLHGQEQECVMIDHVVGLFGVSSRCAVGYIPREKKSSDLRVGNFEITQAGGRRKKQPIFCLASM